MDRIHRGAHFSDVGLRLRSPLGSSSLVVPRVRFCQLPTPLESLPRLSAKLAGPQLFIKRDDAVGLAMGGNKSRMLELLVAAAEAEGADTLITRGHRLSNHCRQTAAAAARFGFACDLVLKGSPRPQSRGNEYLEGLLGARIHWTEGREPEEVTDALEAGLREAGRRPFRIAYGGAQALGAAAYVEALREIAAVDPHFDRVVVAASSGATQAGLVAGAWLAGLRTRIVGVSVDTPAPQLRTRVLELARAVGSCYGLGSLPIPAGAVEIDDRFLAGGYGVVGSVEREAIELFARTEGVLLDPVYTGRAAAALIAQCRAGEIAAGERVLFVHTGGLPSLFELGPELLQHSSEA